MTLYPDYLKTYPNMHAALPLHIRLNRLKHGYPAHRHDFLEFSFVVGGSGAETIDGIVHPMVPGTFTIILPDQVHELFSDPGSPLELYNCNFSMDLLFETGMSGGFGERFEGFGARGAGRGERFGGLGELPSYVRFEGDDAADMRARLEAMEREYRGEERWRDTLLKAMLMETLVRFDRHRALVAGGGRSGGVGGSDARGGGWRAGGGREGGSDVAVGGSDVAVGGDPARGGARSAAGRMTPGGRSAVWPVIHYIHNNYQEELSLTGLARRFSFSVSRMSEVIKEATGQTFVHFLHDVRLRQASGLLVSTDMSVTDIAHEVGFGSYKTFARMFKEVKGVSPTAYRKAKRRHQARPPFA